MKYSDKDIVSISVANRIFDRIYQKFARQILITDRDKERIKRNFDKPVFIKPKHTGNGFVPIIVVLPMLIGDEFRSAIFRFEKLASGFIIGKRTLFSTLTDEENALHFRFRMGYD